MRRETPEIQQHQCSGTGTRVEAHRSRLELERVLHRFGADEVLFVEADANASLQFAMQGRYVQLALPLPDPHDSRFTHTPSGKPRTATAQERAYEQALREHWRSLLVAVRGKLQSVESGISTFEQEFDRFLVPHFADDKKRRSRKAPKAVNWLLGGSHSLAIALVAAFLVPASAVGAFALPTNVVGHLSAPFRGTVSDASAGGQGGAGLVLARGGWSPASGNASPATTDAGHLLAFRAQQAGTADDQLRHEASLSTPPFDDGPPAAPVQPALASAGVPSPIPASNPTSSPPPSAPPPSAPGHAPAPPAPPASDEPSAPPPAPPSSDDTTPGTPPADAGSDSPSSDPAPTGSGQPTTPASDPSSGDSSDSSPADSGTDPAAPPAPGSDPAPGNGNGNGNGNGGNTPPGQSGNTPPGQSGNTPPGQSNPPGNGNGNGNANGQNGTQGQGNGQKTGGKVKGGK